MLFKQKLELCSVIFEFDADAELEGVRSDEDKAGKELKRTTLMELVEWVNTSGGQKVSRASQIVATVAQDLQYCEYLFES